MSHPQGWRFKLSFTRDVGGGTPGSGGGYQTLIRGLEKNYANVEHFSRVGLTELKDKNGNISFKKTLDITKNEGME